MGSGSTLDAINIQRNSSKCIIFNMICCFTCHSAIFFRVASCLVSIPFTLPHFYQCLLGIDFDNLRIHGASATHQLCSAGLRNKQTAQRAYGVFSHGAIMDGALCFIFNRANNYYINGRFAQLIQHRG